MEIKPQELRLTNLFEWKWNKEAVKIEWIRGEHVGLSDFQGSIFSQHIKEINGIELTPEWLERFGFEKQYDDGVWDKGNNRIELTIWGDQDPEWKFRRINGNDLNYWRHSMPPVKYVHQLMNLFHALTGEELAIDKTSLKN